MKKNKSKPKRGDRVKLRGRDPYGTLVKMNEEDGWATVEWLSAVKGPKIVHLDELEVVLMYPDDGGLKEQVRPFEDTFSMWDMFFMEFYGLSLEKAQAHRKRKCEPDCPAMHT